MDSDVSAFQDIPACNPDGDARVFAQIGYFGTDVPTFLRTGDGELAERR